MLDAFFAGVALGLSGAIPFAHTNLVVQLAKGLFSEPLHASVLAVAVAFSHVVFEVVPALLVCVPSYTQNVSILPGHSMLLQGKGSAAFKTILYSLFYGALSAVALVPLALVLLPVVFDALKPFVGVALVLIAAVMFAGERSVKHVFVAAIPFSLACVLGLVALNAPLLQEPLFPLLTGLFGFPALMLSLSVKRLSVKRISALEKSGDESECDVERKVVAAGVFLGLLSVLLPALSPALVAALAFILLENNASRFLSLTSAVVGSRAVFELVGVAAVGKARSGYSALVMDSLGVVSTQELALLVAAGVTALCIAMAVMLLSYRKLIKVFSSVEAGKLNRVLLILVALALLKTSGGTGLLVAGVACAIGLLPPLLKANRSYLMGALIAPTALYYFS